MSSYRHRTAVTRLDISATAASSLEATITAWQRGANIAADRGREDGEARKTKLQSLVYDEVRERISLGSQHSILAIHQAAEALSSVQELRAGGRSVSKPTFSSPTVTYDGRTMTLFEDEESVSLATTDGRLRCGLVLPESDDGYQYQYLDDDQWD